MRNVQTPGIYYGVTTGEWPIGLSIGNSYGVTTANRYLPAELASLAIETYEEAPDGRIPDQKTL